MLIIFDLDDTLIETSKCLTPYYLKFAFNALINAGLKVGDPLIAFNRLLSINEKALSSKIAVKEFWGHYSDNSEILNKGMEALTLPLPEELLIHPVEGALNLLDILGKEATLALVTMGDSPFQYQKMKKAGIQPERFSKIIVGKGLSKKIYYESILEEIPVKPSEVVVCGDRVAVDLSPAKELGFYTIHFENGRGMFHKEPTHHVDLTIKTLSDPQFFNIRSHK